MKALYNFYGVNKRTGVFLPKQVVSFYDESKALNAILLAHADEIKLVLGDPEECQFCLEPVMTFEPIESED